MYDPDMISLTEERAVLTFDRWNPDVGITNDGKHTFHFKQDFPLVVFSYCFPYYYTNVPNYHDYLEITYNCGGTGVWHASGSQHSFAPGDVALIGSEEIHCIRPAAKVNLDLFSIFFKPEIVYPSSGDESRYDLTRPFRDSTRHVLKADEFDHAALFARMLEMHRIDRLKPKFYRLHLRHLLNEAMLQLLHHYDDRRLLAGRPRQSESAIHRLNPVFNLVENHYRERITLDQAAKACNMSRNYFCRFFKNITGTSFIEYLNSFRINQAKQLIIGSDLTATQVAYHVGYNNLGYFFRSFKKHTSLRPKEFAAVHGM
jgi:AraC family transcriptional regulator, transcriptional activator of pobA